MRVQLHGSSEKRLGRRKEAYIPLSCWKLYVKSIVSCVLSPIPENFQRLDNFIGSQPNVTGPLQYKYVLWRLNGDRSVSTELMNFSTNYSATVVASASESTHILHHCSLSKVLGASLIIWQCRVYTMVYTWCMLSNCERSSDDCCLIFNSKIYFTGQNMLRERAVVYEYMCTSEIVVHVLW